MSGMAPAVSFGLLARFSAWASGRVFDAVAGFDDAAIRMDHGAVFGSMHSALNHILVTDRIWLDRLEGLDCPIAALDQILHEELSALRAARTETDARLLAVAQRVDAGEIAGQIRYRSISDDRQFAMDAGHMMLSLLNHQTHHRGQVHAMITRSGGPSLALDIPVFLLEAGP